MKKSIKRDIIQVNGTKRGDSVKKHKLLIILNPRAGKMKTKKTISDLVNVFKNEGYLVSVASTKSRCHATKIVIKKGKKYDVIVCCGGDGTLNEVLSGIVKLKNPPKLGYIPSGTTNDFASGLKLSKNTLIAAKKILKGKQYSIDLGDFDGRTFSYIASFGAFTEVSYKTPQELKNMWGHMAYIIEGIKDIKNIKPYHVKVTADGKVYEDEYIFGSVSNAMSIGGVLKLDPKVAKLDDGLFEVMLIKMPKNLMELQRIGECFIRRHFDDGIINFIQASEIEIEAPKEMNWSLDGEYQQGKELIKIKNINQAVKMLI